MAPPDGDTEPPEHLDAEHTLEAEEAPVRPVLAQIGNRLTDADHALADLRARLAALDEPPAIDEPFAAGHSGGELLVSPLAEYTRPLPNAWLFRDHILVNVGPFADLVDVHGFAESLSELPSQPTASVWGFNGNEAVIKLVADEPLRLADEDLRALPYRPRVTLATPSALTLELELPPPGRPRSDEGPPLHLSN